MRSLKVVVTFQAWLPMGGQDTAYYYLNGSQRYVARWDRGEEGYKWDEVTNIPPFHVLSGGNL